MMAHAVPELPTDRKRVKVYELRNNDWFDRGTGFCVAAQGDGEGEDPRLVVEAEDPPKRLLLESRIYKENGFQKNQETLIVWSEPAERDENNHLGEPIDMALSFQEADGCASIWKFINTIQQQLAAERGFVGPGSMPLDRTHERSITLPVPSLRTLKDIEVEMRGLSNTSNGRDALSKYILEEEYIKQLIPLVEEAEDLESLQDLHRLCNIMKSMILLNDTAIIEYAMTDDVVLGVVGALEYDPDFPSHKANHRLWLSDQSRYREVVHIEDEQIRKKIHHTYRLQYLKDVVLARILDDPTFSILNSLIFFNQVDIVQHLQINLAFLKELFGIFGPQEKDQKRKKDAVLFIQQCCVIAKALQHPARQQLYNGFLSHGLLQVINFALRHKDVGVRVGATDILVAMIDHDPQMIRTTIFRQMNEKQVPLTDSLIELLLVEVDLGVKAHIADAIKVLLDPGPQGPPLEGIAKAGGEFPRGMRPQADPQQEAFLVAFYDDSAKKLFKPLVALKGRETMDFSVQQTSLFVHLIEILCFFIRQHQHRSKYFVLAEGLGQRIAQLLGSNEKHLKLTALKFFRNLIGLQDEFYNQQMMQERLLLPILNIIYESMPRDNLLNSAVLEFFDYLRRENVKVLISHIVEHYREKLSAITFVDLFQQLIVRYDQGFQQQEETRENTPQRSFGNGGRWSAGIREMDEREEDYFNTSDDEDDLPTNNLHDTDLGMHGASPLKPLVDYGSDEEGEGESKDTTTPSRTSRGPNQDNSPQSGNEDSPLQALPEKLGEKRRRAEEEEEDDAFGKLSQVGPKRRNSMPTKGSHVIGSKPKNQPSRRNGGKISSIGDLIKSDANEPGMYGRETCSSVNGASGGHKRKISISIGSSSALKSAAKNETKGEIVGAVKTEDEGG